MSDDDLSAIYAPVYWAAIPCPEEYWQSLDVTVLGSLTDLFAAHARTNKIVSWLVIEPTPASLTSLHSELISYLPPEDLCKPGDTVSVEVMAEHAERILSVAHTAGLPAFTEAIAKAVLVGQAKSLDIIRDKFIIASAKAPPIGYLVRMLWQGIKRSRSLDDEQKTEAMLQVLCLFQLSAPTRTPAGMPASNLARAAGKTLWLSFNLLTPPHVFEGPCYQYFMDAGAYEGYHLDGKECVVDYAWELCTVKRGADKIMAVAFRRGSLYERAQAMDTPPGEDIPGERHVMTMDLTVRELTNFLYGDSIDMAVGINLAVDNPRLIKRMQRANIVLTDRGFEPVGEYEGKLILR